MTTNTSNPAAAPTFQPGPRQVINTTTGTYTLLGTAHVSQASADEVTRLIQSGEFDAVAVELCPGRFNYMQNPDSLAKLDLFQVIKQGKASLVAANLVLGSFQQRIAEQSGITPGAEMQAAIHEATQLNLPLIAIDRDVGITLKRVYRSVPWWQRSALLMSLGGSLFSRAEVDPQEIEKLKQGDMLEATFSEFAAESSHIYTTLIAERDEYMALRLTTENATSRYKNILVVIGAGHLQGLSAQLKKLEQQPTTNPAAELEQLCYLPPKGKFWRYFPWILAVIIVAGFALGFSRDTGLGWQMVLDWVLINGGLSALGVLIAQGHPVTMLAAFIAAPITTFNPTLSAGFVAAAVEIYLRKPKVEDFSNLRTDTARLKGWWHNRVSRTLLVFILATLGSALGTYIGGFHIFSQLSAAG